MTNIQNYAYFLIIPLHISIFFIASLLFYQFIYLFLFLYWSDMYRAVFRISFVCLSHTVIKSTVLCLWLVVPPPI